MRTVTVLRKRFLVSAVALATVLSSPVASAETIRYSMTGRIAAINIDNTIVEFVDSVDGIAEGRPFQASFTFDTSVPDGFTQPTVGSYVQTVPPFALSVSMGGLTLSTSDRAFSLVQIENNSAAGLDAVAISSSTPEMSSGWSITDQASNPPTVNFLFRDFSGRALTSDQLSELPVLNLSMFPEVALANSFSVTLLGARQTLSFPGGAVSAVGFMVIFLTVSELARTTVTNAGDDQTILLGESVTLTGSGTGGTIVSYSWDFGDGSGPGNTATVTHSYTSAGVYVATLTVTDSSGFTASDTAIVTVTEPTANVWIGLANSDDVGIKFDVRAEVYANTTLVGSGGLNSVAGGSSGFNNAKLNIIPMTLTGPVDLPAEATLSMKLYVRNACFGSGKISGRARLWYGDAAANSRLVPTVNPATFYLLDGFALRTSPGSGPRKTIDVAVGAKCSPFKLFGTWAVAMP